MLKPLMTINVHCRPTTPPCGFGYDFSLSTDPTREQYNKLREGLSRLISDIFGENVEESP